MAEILESITRKRNLKYLIRRNQIVSFLLFTLLYSYLIGVPYSVWIKEFSEKLPEFTAVYLQRLIIVYGPGLAAVTITSLTDGKNGLKNLGRKLIPNKKYWQWYLLLPVIASVITFASFLMGGLSFINLSSLIIDNWFILVCHLILQTLVIGIGEELGWRGWLLPKLTNKYSLAITILYIIIIWGVWHLPILFKGPAIVIPWLFMLCSASIIFTWIWLKVQGNISVLAIAHASINSLQFFLESQLGQDENQLLLDSWRVNGCLYLMLGGFFLFLIRNTLAKKQQHI